MRVLLLSRYGRLAASSRLRTNQYVSFLESRGVFVSIAPLLGDNYVSSLYKGAGPDVGIIRGYISRTVNLLQAKRFDALWVEKEMFPWLPYFFESVLLPRGVPLVVDYDDAIFHRYDHHRYTWVRALFGKKIDAIMRRADLVIVGNQYLGDRARQAGAKRVELLPTVVDINRYSVVAADRKGRTTIGWIGSPSTAHYLHIVGSVLQDLISSHHVRVVAVGANPDQLKGLPVEVRPWTEQDEVSEIQQFDIGIMPLPDHPFERGKCGYKLIQYMACSKPVVASPVGANKVIVRDGVEGYLPSDLSQWNDSLRKLCGDPSLRRRLGIAGRARMEREFSLQLAAPRLETLLQSVVRVS